MNHELVRLHKLWIQEFDNDGTVMVARGNETNEAQLFLLLIIIYICSRTWQELTLMLALLIVNLQNSF